MFQPLSNPFEFGGIGVNVVSIDNTAKIVDVVKNKHFETYMRIVPPLGV